MTLGFELCIIALMLVFNAFFAAYEMALASLSRARIAVLVNEKHPGAESAAFMKDRMEASLAVIQLGITLVGVIAAAIGGAGMNDVFSPWLQTRFGFSEVLAEALALICLIIPLSSFTIIFGELIPKMFALANKEHVCLWMSPFMRFLSFVFYPIVSIFELIVKRVVRFGSQKLDLETMEDQGLHELKAAAHLARRSRLIGAREEKIVVSASQLAVRAVSEIMLPVDDIATIPLSASLSDALIKAHMDMHTRFPVCEKENDPQTIHGYINFKDIVLALKVSPDDPTIRGIMRPIKTIDERTPISQVLEIMTHEKIHIALITDRERRVAGMVTTEDILEELVGELEDEYDRLPTHTHPYGGGWIMGGGVLMNALFTKMGMDWPAESDKTAVPPTLHAWCALKLGRDPVGGDLIEDGALRVLVRKLRRHRVAECLVNRVYK